MSRSALWRQEGNVKERQRQAEQLFNLAVEEGRQNRAKNLVPMWGPDDSFHFNPMLLENTIKSQYFQKCCRDLTDWNTLVDQIYYDVKHVEPWAQGTNREPSSAFCLLLRLLTLRCTEKQMKLLLDHQDSPYIRAIGFLYLRYAGDPNVVYEWIAPYLGDQEPIDAAANASKKTGQTETMGEYVRRLFTEKNYYGTILPRLPIHIERDIQVKMLQAEKVEERARKHASNARTMEVFKKLGSKVMALYGDDENPVQWYEAVVDRVVTRDPESSQDLRYPKFLVTFPEYGNTETVSLGEMEPMGHATDATSRPQRGGVSNDRDYGRGNSSGYGDQSRNSHKYDRNRGYENRGYRGQQNFQDHSDREDRRGRGGREMERSRKPHSGQWARSSHTPSGRTSELPNEDDLYEEVRRRERATVASAGRNAFSRRPQTTKSSLSANAHPARRRYDSPERSQSTREREREPETQRTRAPVDTASAPTKRTAEDLAAVREKKRKLLAKYG